MTDGIKDPTNEDRNVRNVIMRNLLEETSALAETWEAEDVVRWACVTYQPELAIASAFGAEGVVLIDIAPACHRSPGYSLWIPSFSFRKLTNWQGVSRSASIILNTIRYTTAVIPASGAHIARDRRLRVNRRAPGAGHGCRRRSAVCMKLFCRNQALRNKVRP